MSARAVEHGPLHLLDEHPLTADGVQRHVAAAGRPWSRSGRARPAHRRRPRSPRRWWWPGPTPGANLGSRAGSSDRSWRLSRGRRGRAIVTALRSPWGDPACALSRTDGSCSSLATIARVSASTASRWASSRPDRALAKRSSSRTRMTSAELCIAAMSGAAWRAVDSSSNRSTSSHTIVRAAFGFDGAMAEATIGPVAQVVEIEHGDAGKVGDTGFDVTGHRDVDDVQRSSGSRDPSARALTSDTGRTGSDAPVLATITSAAAIASSRRSNPTATPPTRSARLDPRAAERLATRMSAPPARCRATATPSPIAPAPTTSTRLPARSPTTSLIISTAAWLTEAVPRPMPVSVRARLPASIAVRNSRFSVERAAPSCWAISQALADLTEDLALAEHGRIEPGGDLEQMADRGGVVLAVQVRDQFVASAGRRARRGSRARRRTHRGRAR